MLMRLLLLCLTYGFLKPGYASDETPDARPGLVRVPAFNNLSLFTDTQKRTVNSLASLSQQQKSALHCQNPLIDTYDEYDLAVQGLEQPTTCLLPIHEYVGLMLGGEKPARDDAFTFIRLLNNKMKVVSRMSLDEDGDNQFPLPLAMTAALAAKLGRAYFEKPTIPPAKLIFEPNGTYELRSYIFENLLDFEDDITFECETFALLHLNPSEFNREPWFITKLMLFDDFFAFADRPRSKQFIIPFDNIRNPRQFLAFYSCAYDYTFYSFKAGYVALRLKGARFPTISDWHLAHIQARLYTYILNLPNDSVFRSLLNEIYNRYPMPAHCMNMALLENFDIWDNLSGVFARMYERYDKNKPRAEFRAFMGILRPYLKGTCPVPFTDLETRFEMVHFSGMTVDLSLMLLSQLSKHDENFNQFRLYVKALITPDVMDSIITVLRRPTQMFDVAHAPLSAIQSLEYLAIRFPEIIQSLKPDPYHTAVDEFHMYHFSQDYMMATGGERDPFGNRYLYCMNSWHQEFLKYYQGRTFDDTERCWQIYVGSNHLTNRLIIHMINDNWLYSELLTGRRTFTIL